jgi:hypothetical protein
MSCTESEYFNFAETAGLVELSAGLIERLRSLNEHKQLLAARLFLSLHAFVSAHGRFAPQPTMTAAVNFGACPISPSKSYRPPARFTTNK